MPSSVTPAFVFAIAAPDLSPGFPWADLWVASPPAWGAVLVGGILAAGIAGQLHLRRPGRRHTAGLEEIRRALDNANYQEAWEACRRNPTTSFSRVIAPALERIGAGLEAVQAAIAAATRREHRRFTMWRTLLLTAGFALPTGAFLLASLRIHSILDPAATFLTARDLTALSGSYTLLLAAWFAVAVATLVTAWAAARSSRAEVEATRAEAETRLGDLAYEDLAGLRIGRDFDAGKLLAGDEPEAATSGRLRVSKALTSACPRCNAAINASHRECPHCHLGLDWA